MKFESIETRYEFYCIMHNVEKWHKTFLLPASPVRSAIYGSNVKESGEIQDRLSQIKVRKKMMDAILEEKHNTPEMLEILHTAAPLVRALGGGRVTSAAKIVQQ